MIPISQTASLIVHCSVLFLDSVALNLTISETGINYEFCYLMRVIKNSLIWLIFLDSLPRTRVFLFVLVRNNEVSCPINQLRRHMCKKTSGGLCFYAAHINSRKIPIKTRLVKASRKRITNDFLICSKILGRNAIKRLLSQEASFNLWSILKGWSTSS